MPSALTVGSVTAAPGQLASGWIEVPDGVESVFEIVIDGLAPERVREAMRRGLVAAAEAGASHVTAGNYGGNLGPHHIHLRELMP